MKPKEIIALIEAKNVKVIDFKFCDIHGMWNHLSIPATELNESVFEDGLGFDASSIRGWQSIESSDMLIIPDPTTYFLDSFTKEITLNLICDIEDPLTREPYSRSPRAIAKKAEAYLKSTGIAESIFIGPEAEFFIFDDVRYHYNGNKAFFSVDSEEGYWNTGNGENRNLGYKIRPKEGYLPAIPTDKTMDLRNEMMLTMAQLGMKVECQHHEVATGGQAEIDLRFDTLLKMADTLCLYKYVVKNVAYQNGRTATFMPKPLFNDNGSGMHVNISLWKGKHTLMTGGLYAGLSQEALWFIGGILQHAQALCALCNPTNNSYKRLVPGYEAPVTLAYSARNRSAIIRIPTYSSSPQAKRIEFRCPDPSANPYLAFSALLMAGLDGIENQTDPGNPIDRNLYDLPPGKSTSLKQVPDSLKGSLEALDKDHKFLLKGKVFTKNFIHNYIKLKTKEYDSIRLRTHPYEYTLYYDV